MDIIEAPVVSNGTSTTCLNCGAALVPDQRYCLACGHPCSPVLLAFLDVLQSEHELRIPSAAAAPIGYSAVVESAGTLGWLRRYSGLLGLLTVLLLAVLVGLLIGHWVTQSGTPAHQVITVDGLSGAPAAATGSAATGSTKTSTAATSTKSSEAAEAKEAKAIKTLPPPVKTSKKSLQKLESTTGKQHQQEINKLTEGGQPLETGGGSGTSTGTSKTPSKSESKETGGGGAVKTIE